MVQVKFKRFGSNSAFGGFSPGDIMRTSEAVAQHLVNQGMADYVQPAASKATPSETEPEKPRKARKVAGKS